MSNALLIKICSGVSLFIWNEYVVSLCVNKIVLICDACIKSVIYLCIYFIVQLTHEWQ